MIGGIEVFLPYSPVEAREVCVADVATTEGQPTVTVKRRRKRHQNLEEERDSAEMLKSQEAEPQEAVRRRACR
jgi:hypothetical protein